MGKGVWGGGRREDGGGNPAAVHPSSSSARGLKLWAEEEGGSQALLPLSFSPSFFLTPKMISVVVYYFSGLPAMIMAYHRQDSIHSLYYLV
jgi:hypothetical protein